jgi:hypothetical protein
VRAVVTPQDLIADGRPLEPARALDELSRLAEALDGVHQGSADLGVTFGAARLQYVSPEQIVGGIDDPTSDVYVLSAVLYRYLTGTVPFPRAHGRAVLFWHLHAPRPRPSSVRADLPAAVDRVIARGMATDPADRPPTPAALIEEARLALGSGGAEPPQRRVVGRASDKRTWLAPLAVVVLAAVAVAAGFLVGGLVDNPSRGALAAAGPLQFTAPADWRRAVGPTGNSSLGLHDALVLAPPKSLGAWLMAGTTTPADSVATLAELHASPPAGEVVTLGSVRARRYRAHNAPGAAGPVTLYLAPTDRGVATVACVAHSVSAAAAFMRRCEGVAVSMRLADGRFTAIGPSVRQAKGQAAVLRRLNTARASYRSRVKRSRTAAGLAAAARELAGAHARAALVLRSLDFTGIARPGGQAAVRAAERAAAAYRSVAVAAADGDRRAYAAARRSALAADAKIRRALRLLQIVGYGA